MNRPTGFDLADLTADDRRAIRNASPRQVTSAPQRPAYALGATTKPARRQRTRDALQVAGGALACIGIVAYLAVFLGY